MFNPLSSHTKPRFLFICFLLQNIKDGVSKNLTRRLTEDVGVETKHPHMDADGKFYSLQRNTGHHLVSSKHKHVLFLSDISSDHIDINHRETCFILFKGEQHLYGCNLLRPAETSVF